MKYNDNGEIKDLKVKAFDTLPIGSVVEYDGTEVPDGYELISNDGYDVITVDEAFSTDSKTIDIPNPEKYKTIVCHIINSYNRKFSIIFDKYILDGAGGFFSVISMPENNINSFASGRVSFSKAQKIIGFTYDKANTTYPLTLKDVVCYY